MALTHLNQENAERKDKVTVNDFFLFSFLFRSDLYRLLCVGFHHSVCYILMAKKERGREKNP